MVRIKQRYLLVHILYPEASLNCANTTPLPSLVSLHGPTPDSLTPQLLLRGLRDQISLLYGDYGAGITANGLSVRYLSNATSTAIVRCSRDNYRIVWAALTWMTELPMGKKGEEKGCVMRVVRVSGTIRKVEEECMKRGREGIERVGEGAILDGIFGLENERMDLEKKGKRLATGVVEEDEDEEVEEGDSGTDGDG